MNALRRMRERLLNRFRDRDYRHTYVDAFLNTSIAAQIRALRTSRKMSQRELATLIGTKQSGVSALENVNYSRWSINTLRKIARVFDVALVVRFESFGGVLDDIIAFDAEKLAKPRFDEDPVFQQPQRSDSHLSDTIGAVKPLSSTVPSYPLLAGETFRRPPQRQAAATRGVVPVRSELLPRELLQYGSGGQTQ